MHQDLFNLRVKHSESSDDPVIAAPLSVTSLDKLTLDGHTILIRCRVAPKRKSSIQMNYHPEGVLFIEHPADIPDVYLRTNIQRHEQWLRERIQVNHTKRAVSFPLKYESGATLWLLGEPKALMLHHSKSVHVEINENLFHVHCPDDQSVQRVVWKWYKRFATPIFSDIVTNMVAQTSITDEVPPWSHGYSKYRWGSCSIQGRIRINTHLIKMPRKYIELIVVHELCHLKIRGHTPNFYHLMEENLPGSHELDQSIQSYHSLLLEVLV